MQLTADNLGCIPTLYASSSNSIRELMYLYYMYLCKESNYRSLSLSADCTICAICALSGLVAVDCTICALSGLAAVHLCPVRPHCC